MILTRSTRLSQPQVPVGIAPKYKSTLAECFIPSLGRRSLLGNSASFSSGIVNEVGSQGRVWSGGNSNTFSGLEILNCPKVLQTPEYTLVAVLKAKGAISDNFVLTNGRSDSYGGESVYFVSSTNIRCGQFQGTTANITTPDINDGKYHTIVATRTNSIFRVHIDGKLIGSVSSAALGMQTGYGVVGVSKGWTYTLFAELALFCNFSVPLGEKVESLISANPWQIFQPVQRRIWFDMGAAGGGGTTYTDSFTESLTASDTHSQSAVFANAISEGLTAADSYLNNAVFADTLSYGITAGDALGHIQSILESLTETVMAGFTQSDSLTGGSGTTYNENITESLTAAYSVVDSATFVNALNEALTVSESLADNAVYSVLVNEALTAVSTFSDSTPGATTLTAADLAAIDALIVARISDIAAATLAAAIEPNYTLQDILKLQSAILLGKVSGAGSGTEVFRDVNDTTDRVTATVDETGNRTAITLVP